MAKDSVSLKEYFDMKISALKQQLNIKTGAIDKSTEIALGALDKRLENMNEFRDTLKDQAAKFVTTAELGLIVQRLDKDIKDLQLAKAILEGKASQESVNRALMFAIFASLASGISITIAIINLITKVAK